MKTSLLLFLILLLALPGLLGCENHGQPRELPSPHFEARKIFPDLSGPRRSSAGAASDADGFEARINQELGGDQGLPSPPLRSVQQIPLGASLIGEIPDDYESWRWARDGNRTLITHTPLGESPDLLIITRDYSFGSALTPARELGAFINDVAPSLGMGIDVFKLLQEAASGELPLAEMADESGDIALDDLLAHIAGPDALTGGRGLGFASAPKSFSGWKWIGNNDDQLFLRIASARGTWGPQPAMPPGLDPAALQNLLGAASEAPGGSGAALPGGIDLDVDGALEALNGLGGAMGGGGSAPAPGAQPTPQRIVSQRPTGLARHAPRPAQLYLGQAELSPDRGVYLLILCASEGHCPHSAELAAFLDRAHSGSPPPSARESDFDALAMELGIHFQ